MAQVEPMDIDAIESDFDNKENTYHHSNVLSRTPCTEKGYEELDVSELNMKLRYSYTPASSPMSKSLTGSLDNRNCNHGEDYLNAAATDNGNLTRSLNSTFSKTDSTKTKVLPLKTLSSDPFVDSNRNSIHRFINPDDNNITISVSANDVDNLSLPSTSSSVVQTPEATTPTKEIPKPEGSPILRGLKSVLSMFRPSQSPIPPADDRVPKQDVLSPIEKQLPSHINETVVESVRASTPVDVGKQKEVNSSKRSSPLKESVVFNDDLERELQWKDETTIIFKQEKIPVHKLFFQNPLTPEESKKIFTEHLNTTVEHMDISCNESILADNTTADIEPKYSQNEGAAAVESDNEFLDCETTFTKNESRVSVNNPFEEKNTIISDTITVQLSKSIEDSEYKNVMDTTQCILENVNAEFLQDATIYKSDKIEKKSSEITEVISNNEELVEEIIMLANQNISLHNDFQSTDQDLHCVHEPNVTMDDNQIKTIIDESVIQSKDNLNDLQSMTFTSTQIVTNEVEDLPDVYPATSNQIEILEEANTITMPVNKIEDNKSILLNNVNEIDFATNIETNKEIDLKPLLTNTNIQEQSMPIIVENTQVIQLEIDKDVTVVGNSEILVDKSTNEVSSSTIVKNMNPEERAIDLKTKEMFITECTKRENYAPQNTIDMMESNLSVTLIESNLLSSVVTTDIELKAADANQFLITHNCNNAVHINEEKQNLLKIVEADDNISQDNVAKAVSMPCNTVTNNFVSINKDLEMSKLVLENDVIGKLPPEIPLPDDDDDIEKPIMEGNNVTEEVILNQNITFEINNEKINIDIENKDESAAEFKKLDNNSLQEHSKTFLQNVTNKYIDISNTDYTELNRVDDVANNSKTLNANTNTNASDRTSNVLLSEIKHLQNDIQTVEHLAEALNTAQDVISIKADFGAQTTRNTCETTQIFIENEKFVANSETTTEVIAIAQGDIDGDLAESSQLKNETFAFKESSVEKVEDQISTDQEKRARDIDEEIITSANNSPYVSVTDLALDVEVSSREPREEIDNPFTNMNKITASPPVSPKIVSKGYNFNFDEVGDPFATKTKIRMSPTPSSPNQSSNNLEEDLKKAEEVSKKINNRRKTQIERKRQTQKKNSVSTTQMRTNGNTSKRDNQKQNVSLLKVTVSLPEKQNIPDPKPEDNETVVIKDVEVISQNVSLNINGVIESPTLRPNTDDLSPKNKEIFPTDGEFKCLEQTLVISDQQSTSSSEQYFSLGTSSGESVGLMNRSKNVFNIPEIDDVNFNPFATKSKMRMSPLPSENKISPIEDKNNSKIDSSFVLKQKEDKESGVDDVTFDKTVTNDSSPNAHNETCSSKDMNDKHTIVHEILTEDEDTIEGPFLEADDFKDIEKMNDMDVENDMMNFDEAPAQERDENLENAELFIDADAFEFLLNQNKSSTVLDSGKESLFLKFDPLFARKVSSDGVLAALSKVQKRQSTPKKPATNTPKDTTNSTIPVAGPSNIRENYESVEEYSEDPSSTMTKPMMVVNPAVSSIISPRKVTATPKLNRRSLTLTSPAMAVIDRLLSLSGNASHLNEDSLNPHVSREHTETDFAITQLRELLAEKEIHVHNLRCESKELKDRLAALEVQVRSLETESSERLMKINDLNERLSEKTKINKSMATVVEEYERTIASLIAESEQDKKHNAAERIRLIKERDEQTAHLTSMEVSFSDLHSKYEKSKQIILTCKANEDTYKKSIKEFEDNFLKMQNNYELLKQHATSKLNHANQELEKMNRAHEAEVLKLNAMIKRKELHTTSLEETLAQKTKANEELTAICDELINKVG